MAKSKTEIPLVKRRHHEWRENQIRWMWLADSLEGGDRYRSAIYGYDDQRFPLRNLVRHKREYPSPRESSAGSIGVEFVSGINQPQEEGDYGMRLARTPVPEFVAEAAESWCSRIFGGDIVREAPEGPTYDPLREWWEDVDGSGVSIGEWMREVVAPLILTLGQLDVCFDHPPAPEGTPIESQADVDRLGLNRCVAKHILPENVVWWRLDPTTGAYLEVLICEPYWPEDGGSNPEKRYRHWTAQKLTVLAEDGSVIEQRDHPFGVVPVVRVFDRKKPRCTHVGKPRLEAVAEHQREYYNRDSELILSDTTQAHPLIQCPEDFVQSDGTIPIGPSWLLPKKKNGSGGTATYEGFDVVNFPKEGADSIRRNKLDLRDAVDRIAVLVKPSGSSGRDAGGQSVVAQSGASKAFDHAEKHAALKSFAKTLAKIEATFARMALSVIFDGRPIEEADVKISYPSVFSLVPTDDLSRSYRDFQSMVAVAGRTPLIDEHVLKSFAREMSPGLDDEQYAEFDREIERAVSAAVSDVASIRESLTSSPNLMV